MHLLEDPSGLSPRALAFLDRSAHRQERTGPHVPTELLRVRDRRGRPVPAPLELVIRREGFAQRYGGLRYTVRESHPGAGGERRVSTLEWHHEPGSYAWADPVRGWFFDWWGPRAAHPVRYLVHTDGRVGAESTAGDGVFQELEASMVHRIESHALVDELSAWDRWPGGAAALATARHLDGDGNGLSEVAEASGPGRSWRTSETVAVTEFAPVSPQHPRGRCAWIWYRGEEGRRRVTAAAALAAAGHR
ncbi:hypothetical protein Kpho02_06130 [Kitasatospora phosalacinea]|uniref:Uncharacterized protein n=1 Tax=Kitasatospora phosalacinea TaxID=2065 RepID=A0A9W6UYB4_9ACTN|nr:hypothetical protein [Kitasatospora phosalacinea]GLW68314.1 hypothetical protein Kpho02_06130 [Kitasatospora phosalacinea]